MTVHLYYVKERAETIETDRVTVYQQSENAPPWVVTKLPALVLGTRNPMMRVIELAKLRWYWVEA